MDGVPEWSHIAPTMRVGFIGLGIMGSGMISNLVQKGHQVEVWNRTAQKAEASFPQLHCCASPRELTQRNEVVICCVSGPDAVERVLFGPDGVAAAESPTILIECSTIGPDQAAENASRLEECGAQMLAAPVTGSKLGARNGTLLFMTGGSDALRQQLEPLLLCMGERVVHCGSVAQAFAVKLANNALVSFMLQGLCEGATVVQKAGIDLATWLAVIGQSVLACRFHEMKGDALLRRDFSTHFSLDLMLKDQILMLDFAAKNSVLMPGLTAIRDVFRSGQADGLGADDMVGIIRLLERENEQKKRLP